MSGSTVDFGIEFLDGFSAVDQDIGPCVIGHEDGVIVRVLGDVGQDVVLVQVACQCDIHRHLGQLIAILDEAVGQLRVRAGLDDAFLAHLSDTEAAVQGAAVGLTGLLVGILKEEAGHARRMAGAQAEGDGEAAHGQGVLHIVEIRDRVGG